MDRDDTQEILSDQPDGTFLIRFSDTSGLVASMVDNSVIKQSIIRINKVF